MRKKPQKKTQADPVKLYLQQMFSDGLFMPPDQLLELEKKSDRV